MTGPVASGVVHRAAREAVIDLDAVMANVGSLREHARGAAVMAVVKADAYGHGLAPVARAARAGGAGWLGVALLDEALALRAAGDTGPVLAWLLGPGADWAGAIRADVDVSVSAEWALAEVVAAARDLGLPARVHLKVDTGLGRAGATLDTWPRLVEVAATAQAEGAVQVVGVWSHLAYADTPEHPTVGAQAAAFADALRLAAQAGVRPHVRHLANSAATLLLPGLHYDLVRPGLAVYGLSPVPDRADPDRYGLRPAMTLSARLVLTKRVAAGSGVSYGHAYRTAGETTVGVVPLGYADGLPRHASNTGPMLVAGRRHTVAGRVCMDQVVVDLGDDPAEAGDEVVLFGPGDRGEPSAQDWAEAAGTISYEIVARLGPRVPRRYLGGPLEQERDQEGDR